MRTNLDINIFIKDSVPKYMDVNEHERLFNITDELFNCLILIYITVIVCSCFLRLFQQ
jgi:hypothetical protein